MATDKLERNGFVRVFVVCLYLLATVSARHAGHYETGAFPEKNELWIKSKLKILNSQGISIPPGSVNIYPIWSGDWSAHRKTKLAIKSFLNSLKDSGKITPRPSVYEWWCVIREYYTSSMSRKLLSPPNITISAEEFSAPSAKSSSPLLSFRDSIFRGLPFDESGLYFIFSSPQELITRSHCEPGIAKLFSFGKLNLAQIPSPDEICLKKCSQLQEHTGSIFTSNAKTVDVMVYMSALALVEMITNKQMKGQNSPSTRIPALSCNKSLHLTLQEDNSGRAFNVYGRNNDTFIVPDVRYLHSQECALLRSRSLFVTENSQHSNQRIISQNNAIPPPFPLHSPPKAPFHANPPNIPKSPPNAPHSPPTTIHSLPRHSPPPPGASNGQKDVIPPPMGSNPPSTPPGTPKGPENLLPPPNTPPIAPDTLNSPPRDPPRAPPLPSPPISLGINSSGESDQTGTTAGSSTGTSPSSGPPPAVYAAILVILLLMLLLVCALIVCLWRRKAGFGFRVLLASKRGESAYQSDVELPSGGRVKNFEFDELKVATRNFSLTFEEPLFPARLGNSDFGPVFKGVMGGRVFAVERAKTTLDEDFVTAVDAIASLKHSNVVPLEGVCRENGEEIFVYGFEVKMSLKARLLPPYGGLPALTFSQRVRVAVDAARGLHHLHRGTESLLVHSDVKSESIFLDEWLTARISLFGIAESIIGDREALSMRFPGSLGYKDPEFRGETRMEPKSDVYSFGVVLLELMTGKSPFVEEDAVTGGVMTNGTTTLVTWVNRYTTLGRFGDIVDPALREQSVDMDMFMKVLHLAYLCTQRAGKQRPSMDQVADRLEQIAVEVDSSSPFHVVVG